MKDKLMKQLNLQECQDNVRKAAPLTLTITNQVTINECANALLAIGASPVMSGHPDDAEALAAIAAAVVLNIGMINQPQLEVMLAAGRGAAKAGKPVILDPVGAGATALRFEAARRLIEEAGPTVIRGNFSEIKALAGLAGGPQKGVDSAETEDVKAASEIAADLAGRLQTIVAVTGATDVVAGPDGNIFLIEGGTPLLTRLTGTGCLLSAMVGAYAGANAADRPAAVIAAMSHLALAGERAAGDLPGPQYLGSFRAALFDQLTLVGGNDLGAFQGVRRP
ncbi:hydroxyethylthiazole kinase [Deltaproteobacteria bacterium OttesenSCG-928-M10]|nr:hydroxyethylthiazole kinase [Deltaproteobacteria bacterium OttesenSCG-928-M10]